MIPALEALDRLRERNRRFAAGVRSIDSLLGQAHRSDLVEGRTPFAVILGCSDSRVVEIVIRSGSRGSVRHPRCRECRRALADRQCGVCRGEVRDAARRGVRSLELWRDRSDTRGAAAAG